MKNLNVIFAIGLLIFCALLFVGGCTLGKSKLQKQLDRAEEDMENLNQQVAGLDSLLVGFRSAVSQCIEEKLAERDSLMLELDAAIRNRPTFKPYKPPVIVSGDSDQLLDRVKEFLNNPK